MKRATCFLWGVQVRTDNNNHGIYIVLVAQKNAVSLSYFQVYQACTGVPAKGLYYPPTLITDVQPVSKVVAEEVTNFYNLITEDTINLTQSRTEQFDTKLVHFSMSAGTNFEGNALIAVFMFANTNTHVHAHHTQTHTHTPIHTETFISVIFYNRYLVL